ncbi:MAG: DUF2155 domain-containing protein [Alphaproteobacteria bacterium]|nr:MAG: DUF2155 domain-containing protein [Alphaproteobacteria bacterium]
MQSLAEDAKSGNAAATLPPETGSASEPQEAPATVTIVRALDKITGRTTELELPQDRPVRFGTLRIVARHCESRPPEEEPETFAFLEIDDMKDDPPKRVFSGWMMASSPALHALEHPIYDVWVIACRTSAPPAEGESR